MQIMQLWENGKLKLYLRGKKNIFEEIAEQYRYYIQFGIFSDGEKLPSCRELAIELGINPNTVERAYGLLESEGFVITMPKKGTFVVGQGHMQDNLIREAEKQLSAFKTAGLTRDELLILIERIYKEESSRD